MTSKRIAYIISPGPTEGRGVPADVLTEAVSVDLFESTAFVFPTDPLELMITEMSALEAGVRAGKQSYDGVLIGALADYGIGPMRSALSVPVVGCGQASLLTAASVAKRFGIVTIWPSSTAWQYRETVNAHGLQTRCVSIRHVSRPEEMATLGEEDNFYTQMRSGQEAMLARIVAEIDAAVRDDGAEAIVLGCNCMTPVAKTIGDRVEVPVIDPTRTGYAFLSMLLALELSHSPAAHPRAHVDRSPLLHDMVAATRHSLDGGGEAAETCEVCVLGDGGDTCGAGEPAASAGTYA